jgi:hypothetical protein
MRKAHEIAAVALLSAKTAETDRDDVWLADAAGGLSERSSGTTLSMGDWADDLVPL